ncbi:MAG: sigma-70 family RNA polymerase sigma factor [Pyrinomonadaceae bacterium]
MALNGQAELEQAALAALEAARPTGENSFLDRLKSGDPIAFERLVNERSSDVYALLYRLTEDPEEARDLTQETFLSAFRHIGRFRGDADLKTWLYRIAMNHARNRWRWWRRRRKDVTVSLDDRDRTRDEPLSARLQDRTSLSPEGETLEHEREAAIRAALKTLSRSYREIVILRDLEGLSYDEIAATLEIGMGTVKSRLARGRLELRRKLAPVFGL